MPTVTWQCNLWNELRLKSIKDVFLHPSGGGAIMLMDSAYNPLSINEDYFFPQTAEGRGSKVETLPGGTNLGEIDDLKILHKQIVKRFKNSQFIFANRCR